MALNTKKLYLFNLFSKIAPPTHFFRLKASILRWCGATVGNNVEIFSPRIMGNFNLNIGNGVSLNHESLIFGASDSSIIIEDNVIIGSRSIIVTGFHDYDIKYDRVAGPGRHADVRICKGACVSTHSIILPGKTVGEKAHVAAGSVVTHDVPAFHRVAGVPAKVIRDLRIPKSDK